MFVNAGSCPLEITPCATVEASRDIRIYDRVMERFPKATFLKEHDAYAYCGFPSLDNQGKVVAVTCLLDDRPHEFSVEDQEMLRIIGQRVGLEIERHHLHAGRQAGLIALQQSESRFRDVAQAAGEFIWEVDVNGRFTLLTQRVKETYGYAAEDLLGKAIYFQLAEEARRTRESFQAAVSEKRPLPGLAYRLYAANGEMQWIHVSGVPIFDEHGQVSGLRGTALNITERRRAQEKLDFEHQRLREVLESLPVFA